MTRRAWRMGGLALVLAVAVTALVLSLPFGTRPARETAPGGRHPVAPPFLIYRNLAARPSDDTVALLRLASPGAGPGSTALSCLRVHYAGGRGLCVAQEGPPEAPEHAAYVFDKTLVRGLRIELPGVATRVRVSPDGQRGAVTTYAEVETPEGERLATDSVVIDLRSGQVIADLATFRIEDDHGPLAAPIDVGSVAFERDGDRFFASIATPDRRYLGAGSLREGRVTLLRADLASEALSPDGGRLAVKKPGPHGFWQLAVLDLRTWIERDLPHGTRSVDDQVEWFDDEHLLYHDADDTGTALWLLSVRGNDGPRVLVRGAYSGAVQR